MKGSVIEQVPGALLANPGAQADQVIALVNKVNFLPFTTVILAMAGLSILKDLPAFRKLGWKIVVVSLAANAGTFLGATMIAEFFH